MEKQPLSEEHKRVLFERAAYWDEVAEHAKEQRLACLRELGMIAITNAPNLVLIQGGRE